MASLANSHFKVCQQIKEVPIYQYTNDSALKELLKSTRIPLLIKGFDVGTCKELWTSEYLHSACDPTPVAIHVSLDPKLDFVNKNYEYRTLPLNDLCKRCGLTEHSDFFLGPNEFYYLRALGENPSKDVADFYTQLPDLVNDFLFPKVLDEGQYFSSVFRVASANLQLFTHYDIMDNILVQIQGRKRVALFSPSDTNNLYLRGDKSPIIDIDSPDWGKFPNFANAIRWECILEPGDMLFIPSPWLHNVKNLEFTVAINVFWKNLDPSLYTAKDVYGNKDLVPAQRANQIMARALKILEELPPEFREFYGRKMISHIQDKTFQ